MRSDFESASSSLIEVDPYYRSIRNNSRQANVSSIDFRAGRGSSGVDLRWHTRKEFLKLSKEQKDELSDWLKTDEGKKHKKERFQSDGNTKDGSHKRKADDKSSGGNWKKKFRKAIKTDKGLKSIMSIMASEEQNNQALMSALAAATTLLPTPTPQVPPHPPTVTATSAAVTARPSTTATVATLAAAFPATNIKLNSILQK
jgi:hypothetical protein